MAFTDSLIIFKKSHLKIKNSIKNRKIRRSYISNINNIKSSNIKILIIKFRCYIFLIFLLLSKNFKIFDTNRNSTGILCTFQKLMTKNYVYILQRFYIILLLCSRGLMLFSVI